jgi:hypothetical protein
MSITQASGIDEAHKLVTLGPTRGRILDNVFLLRDLGYGPEGCYPPRDHFNKRRGTVTTEVPRLMGGSRHEPNLNDQSFRSGGGKSAPSTSQARSCLFHEIASLS